MKSFWGGHHIVYHAVLRADRILLWLNILLFMFVSLLPFSTTMAIFGIKTAEMS